MNFIDDLKINIINLKTNNKELKKEYISIKDKLNKIIEIEKYDSLKRNHEIKILYNTIKDLEK